jgi:hypothetical protein
MAVNKPVGDNARKGAVKKRTQLKTRLGGVTAWTKRSKTSGEFMAVKKPDAKKTAAKKFKGVRREKRQQKEVTDRLAEAILFRAAKRKRPQEKTAPAQGRAEAAKLAHVTPRVNARATSKLTNQNPVPERPPSQPSDFQLRQTGTKTTGQRNGLPERLQWIDVPGLGNSE